jgi:hypothetical protein
MHVESMHSRVKPRVQAHEDIHACWIPLKECSSHYQRNARLSAFRPDLPLSLGLRHLSRAPSSLAGIKKPKPTVTEKGVSVLPPTMGGLTKTKEEEEALGDFLDSV